MVIAASAKIYPGARVVDRGDALSIGDHSRIDDFAFVNPGRSCRIGRFVHIASFVSVVGGGAFEIGDFSGLSAGCRIITGTDDYGGPFLTNPTVPAEFTNVHRSHVTIGKHVIVGTNAVVFPGVTIGDGAAVGACAVVRRDLPPWGIYAGDPLRRIGQRDGEAILAKAAQLMDRLAPPGRREATMVIGGSVGARIREFVGEAFFAADFSDDESLIQTGIVDSTGMLELVSFLEAEFGITVEEDELVPENLDSVARAAAFVARKLGRTAA